MTITLIGSCGCEVEADVKPARMRLVNRICICDPSMGRIFRFAGEFDGRRPIFREVARG